MSNPVRSPVLLRNARVYQQSPTPLTAVLIEGDQIVWVGTEDGAELITASRTIDLDGCFLTPAFVDSHLHATATGLSLTGLDLSKATSLATALQQIARFARSHEDGIILGSGWDESTWPEGRAPTRTELDVACGNRPAYFTRVDVHSALASSALLDRAPEAATMLGGPAGYDDAHVRLEAHHVIRRRAMDSIGVDQRRRAQQATLRHAAERGIGTVVEMAGPEVSSELDLTALLALADDPGTVTVAAYWGELDRIDVVTELGLAGAGGDLFCDGALGSHTAALDRPYLDSAAAGVGHLWLDRDQVAGHVRRCTEAGIQAGFHAIGDRAVDAVVGGIADVADALGVAAVSRLGHRIEHCEMASAASIATMARLGIVASVQPMFDRLWGGRDQMYAQRLGDRATSLNPYAEMAAAGVSLAFGSDAPVTTLDSWAGVHGAIHHHTPQQRISARAAFAAATRGGWRALGRRDGAGQVVAGAPAYLSVWQPTELTVRRPDSRVQAWSTDPRAGTSGLPVGVVGSAAEYDPPQCLGTISAGEVVFDSGVLADLR